MASGHRRVAALTLILAISRLSAAAAHADARPTGHTVSHPAQVVLTTADLSSALSRQSDVSFSPSPPAPGVRVIDVQDSVGYQRFLGVGAAMTDSSAWLIHSKLAPHTAAVMMRRLFGKKGIHIGFLRLPMGASDFTAREIPYSYDDLASGQADPELADFSIAHDRAYVIPAIRQALSDNPSMFLLATPWSAPGWMKSNDRLSNVRGSGRFEDRYQGVLARYFVKFLESYRTHGIRIDAVTPQNEPDNWTAYPGMQFSPTEEENFVRLHLAPMLAKAGLSTEIFGADVGWDKVAYAGKIADSRAASTLAGIATHCYYGSPTVISSLHHENPSLEEIVSECSPGITPFSTTEVEISALRNWASAVALWNLALNPAGGPVQPPNAGCPICTALMTIDESSRTATPTSDYYELGQVSKFVDPGARRIKSNSFVTYTYPPSTVVSSGLDDVAFRNPDGTEVLVCYDNAPTSRTFAVRSHGRSFTYTLGAGSTATFRWRVH